tara:strand:- start:762 stop:1289 length:528 start_codon:yes stop_codon:yes gene_type:complete
MKNSILILVLILFGCESNPLGLSNNWPEGDIEIVLDTQLSEDENGYYHMELSSDSWQTLHRISGTAYVDGEPLESFPVSWESSHYWLIGDTLGYVVNQGLTDDLIYVSYDTTYVTWFNGFEVKTINESSYSNGNGEINTMFAPVQTMSSDSVTIKLYYTNYENELIEQKIEIILE